MTLAKPPAGPGGAVDPAAPGGDPLLAELQTWLTDSWDPDLPVRAWWQRLTDAGWSAPTWSREWFGRELTLAGAVQVNRTISAFGALPGPGGFGGGLVGPTVLVHGDDDQKKRHLPPIAYGTLAWCQLFSEPGAGSDLAGLQTRAERDGDTWVVSGQKVWTSGGQIADWAMLLARTDLDVPKHAGISYFLIDMQQPGIEVRPLREMTGRSFFNEVFLTEARVSAHDLVGGEGNGWVVANTTLAFERSMAAAGGTQGRARPGTIAADLDRRAGDLVGSGTESGEGAEPGTASERLTAMARAAGRAGDPVVRQALARLYSLEQIADLNAQRARAASAAGSRSGADGTPNLAKMAQNCGLRVLRDLTFDILGPAGMLYDYRSGAPAGAGPGQDLVEAALFAQGPQIYGGSDQIQRNIVGERVLGLAKEPRQDQKTPFRDLPRNG
jgi:alkylation response protein AidB-like acyl-CoA dehydrogenase